jgi:hypothetical protein
LLGLGLERSFSEEFRWSLLHRLDPLWNLDKHRRLTLMAWWPELFYWTSNGPTRRTALPGDGTFADGSVLLYIEGSDDSHGSELQHEFKLVLTDDPAFQCGRGAMTDVPDLLEQFYEHIVQLISRVPEDLHDHVGSARGSVDARPVATTPCSRRLVLRGHRGINDGFLTHADLDGLCISPSRSAKRKMSAESAICAGSEDRHLEACHVP